MNVALCVLELIRTTRASCQYRSHNTAAAEFLTGYEHLELYGKLYGIPDAYIRTEACARLAALGLDRFPTTPVCRISLHYVLFLLQLVCCVFFSSSIFPLGRSVSSFPAAATGRPCVASPPPAAATGRPCVASPPAAAAAGRP